ncbi:MAG: ABC transporter ATP-binding protein [Actinomycetota bacterium]|nr:ABC transporter ATP-binding protein [Actinomycetota bacterium]
MPLLELTDVRTGYGSLPVLHGISFAVEQGELAVMLGLNGAGKSTTMMAIAGLLKTWSGSISFEDASVGRLDTAKRVQRGIVLVPEGRRVFPALSVTVNLRLGAWVRRRDRKALKERMEKVFEYFPRLAERRNQLAGTMSGGEQQMLAVGRGLMADPKLLLIDEASLGLAPKTAQELFQTVKQISKTGVTVIMVEQNAGALDVADRAFIMEKGTLIFQGAGDEELKATDLRAAYLG